MDILANNLLRQYSLHAQEYEKKALEVLRSGWYILGREVACFEQEWASFVGAQHCAGLASGLDALWIALKILGIGAGDEVIVAANAYIACIMGISIVGATPIFVEPDEYHNIDVDQIEKKITSKTRAILPVHLYGQACNMTKIMSLAKKYNLRVVEDCAQSHGSLWEGQVVGSFGDVACFSYYPTKGCGAFGDAGAVTTNDPALDQMFRTFRNYGSKTRYFNEVVGTNSRLDELQAGLLRVKLAHLGALNDERKQIAARYLAEINNKWIALPETQVKANHVWHQFVIRSKKRNEIMEYLKNLGIGTIIHYPIPPHLSEAYAYLGYKSGDFPITERNANEVLSLPIYNGMTDEEITYTICAINRFDD